MEKLTGIAVIKPGSIGVYYKDKEGRLFGTQVEESIGGINVLIASLEGRRDAMGPKPGGDVV